MFDFFPHLFGDYKPGEQLVNSRGDQLSDSDREYLFGQGGPAGPEGFGENKKDPVTFMHMLMNWLTGGKPTKIDPSVIFKDTQAFAPVENRAAAGRGINGLFGIGNLIGDIAPIEPIKPLNQSPMQPGVPYSVPPIPKPGGG